MWLPDQSIDFMFCSLIVKPPKCKQRVWEREIVNDDVNEGPRQGDEEKKILHPFSSGLRLELDNLFCRENACCFIDGLSFILV